MEVFIKDVPEQVTEPQVRRQLQPYMDKLSIKRFHCQKPGKSRFAFLVFLHSEDGSKFLATYGQDKPSRMSIGAASKIHILSVPVYCSISNKLPNEHFLRCLAKEEKDAKVAQEIKARKPVQEQSKVEGSREFRTSSMACGIWSYVRSELVFVPYFTTPSSGSVGSAKFGSRSLLLQFDSGDRVEFSYAGISQITAETTPDASFTLTLWGAPRTFLSTFDGKQRNRVSSLNSLHQVVVGSCAVYRISLKVTTNSSSSAHKISERMHALQREPGLPAMGFQQTNVHQPTKSFQALQRELDVMLADTAKFPSWTLNFQIRALVSNMFLSPEQTMSILPEISRIFQRSGLKKCIATLQKFRGQIPYAGPTTYSSELEIASLLESLKAAELQVKEMESFRADDDLPRNGLEDVALIHRITVTPAGVYLDGPEVEPMNRVLRKYSGHHDSFIRVLFADEDGEPVRYNPRVSNDLIYNERFKNVLRHGINVAGRQYNFLGFSHSSLRAQSCWFMAPFINNGSLLLDRQLIAQLGDFSKIHCPAKCAARIGQAFSETPIAVSFPQEAVRVMDDVERNGRVFSDGVGTVSWSVVRKIWKAVPSMKESRPTCFQIRYRGAKGMVSLDSRLVGDKIFLRPSMIKFEGSTSMDIELCGSSLKPLPMYLNRQVIKILEDMDVQDEWFLSLQSKEVQRLRMITMNAINAGNYLRAQLIGQHSHLGWFIKKLATIKLEFRSDRFLRDVLETSVMMQIRVLKYRARIPVKEGMTLYGIMDETGILEEGQIFCIFVKEGKKKILVRNKVVITRAPALHPGDVQLADAVNVPGDSPLLSLSNCICFSQKGKRDLPSKLSGGDLDGDLYNIIWDKGCQPSRTCLPADYARVPPEDIGRTVGKDDMTDFFVKFMETDQLGRIATSHLILADQKLLGTSDPACRTLAELHSTAVDFSKTGIPVNLKLMPRFIPVRPDFMAPGPNIKIEKKEGLLIEQAKTPNQTNDDDEEDFTPYKYYESNKILGKLYRAVDEHEIFDDLHKYRIPADATSLLDRLWTHVARACRMVPWRQYVREAEEIRDTYEDCLLKIMRSYSQHPLRPLTELEAFIGNILGAQGSQSRKQRDLSMTMKEVFDNDVAFVVGRIIGADDDYEDGDDDEIMQRSVARSVACFHVSLGEATRVPMGARGRGREELVSFRYVAAAVCLKQLDLLVERELGEGLGIGRLNLK